MLRIYFVLCVWLNRGTFEIGVRRDSIKGNHVVTRRLEVLRKRSYLYYQLSSDQRMKFDQIWAEPNHREQVIMTQLAVSCKKVLRVSIVVGNIRIKIGCWRGGVSRVMQFHVVVGPLGCGVF